MIRWINPEIVIMPKAKFIYNPKAGSKQPFVFRKPPEFLLDTIHDLFRKYEIEVDEAPLKDIGDARRFAAEARSQGYDTVIVAGGDGTVGEVANGLVGTDIVLGILPMGTFMNVARMLSIPFDLEHAVMLLKMRNIRLIDVGELVSLKEGNAGESVFFLESVGVGIEADFQHEFLAWERGDMKAIARFMRKANRSYVHPLRIELDDGRLFESIAHEITVSNGPYSGASIPVAPSAKLNDHLLTVRQYHMSKKELVMHVAKLKLYGHHVWNPKIDMHTSGYVRLTSESPRPVHADARVFGTTPVSITVRPNALRVIAGYPDSPRDSAFIPTKTFLAP